MSFDEEVFSEPDQFLEPEPVESDACRRCRNEYAIDQPVCPYCGASNPQVTSQKPIPANSNTDRHALISMSLTYACLLFSSVSLGIIASLAESDDFFFPTLLIGDIVLTIVVLWSWVYTKDIPNPEEDNKHILWAWSSAFPLITLGLLLNLSYHNLLLEFGAQAQDETFVSLIGSFAWAIILICIQPALIEELFFRGVAWKCLRQHGGTWSTLLITSIMFGFCHIGAPLSIPVLIVVGLILGLARALSGSLWLPMLLHFVHNLVVVLLES